MLRSSLCLLFMVACVSVALVSEALAQHTDVQSLEYEFGRTVVQKPVVYAPVERGCGCAPVYTTCSPCYTPYYKARCYRCYPATKVYRRAYVRPMYASPYYFSPYYYGW